MTAVVKTRPLIGLPGRRRKVGHLHGTAESMADVDVDLYFSGYARSVLQAGGLPIHLPSTPIRANSYPTSTACS